MYPKKNNFLRLLNLEYDDSIVELVKKHIEVDQHFTKLIDNINYIGDVPYTEFQNKIVKILHETNNYNYRKNINELISRVINKKITFHINHLKLMEIEWHRSNI